MPKAFPPLYNNNTHPVISRQFGLTSHNTPTFSPSQVPVAPAAVPRNESPHDHPHDEPMDVDEDFIIHEPEDAINNINNEVPPLPEAVVPGLNVRSVKKAKQYENLVINSKFERRSFANISLTGRTLDYLEAVLPIISRCMHGAGGTQAVLQGLHWLSYAHAPL